MDGLAASLPHGPERYKRTPRDQPGFLVELAKRALEQVVGPNQSFRNGPGAIILFRPERPARMRQQKFEQRPPAIDQKACADLGSACHAPLYSRRAADWPPF